MLDVTTTDGPRCDVLIAGGGPAGSTLATLLARRGHAVVLLEKAKHPRFHIGESLLPMNLPIFERLGVLDRLEAIGVRKLGADFPAPNERGYNTFRFERALDAQYPYAYQVRRDALDALLFAFARENGVDAREGVKVDAVSVSADGATVLAGGETIRARHFVDATGRDTLLGAQLGLKQRHPQHASAALFAHFRGVERRPGEDAGNISIYRFAHGWVWLIPLPDDVTSIGAVCWPDYMKQRRGRNEAFLLETLATIPELQSRLAQAEIVGNLHATGNYSYECARFAGEGWTAVGDACAFVDPIFSSGVYLAMSSAESAVEVVEKALSRAPDAAAARIAYERRIRGGIDTFSWFIYRFTSPTMKHLFANPRNYWQLEDALVAMLAGDVYNPQVKKRLALFKVVYYFTALRRVRAAWADFVARRRQRHVAFEGGTTAQDSA